MNPEKIKSALANSFAGALEIEYFDQIDSTNTRAKLDISSGARTTPALYLAGAQSAGRGRRGRAFASPQGGLYMSLALPLSLDPAGWGLVTPAAAVGVWRAVLRTCRITCGIKWVNDLELSGKKVCGILTERVGDWAVIGIGLNLEGPPPPGLEAIAASLYPHGGAVEPEALAAAIAGETLALITALPSIGFMADYRAQSTLLGRDVTVHTALESYPARVLDICDNGHLRVQAGGQTLEIASGQVSVRLEK